MSKPFRHSLRLSLGAILSVLILQFSTLPIAHSSPKVIYGADNRRDTYEVKDVGTLQRADSTVALLRRQQISIVQSTARIQATQFGQSYELCAGERFRDQPNGAFCSGTLVAPNLILTAGHCITNMADCQGAAFVFGYKMNGPGRYPTAVPAAEVYGCRTIVARKLEQAANPAGANLQPIFGADFAIIELDRAVTNHRPLPVNKSGSSIRVGTPLVMIGHPSGLPQKIENGGKVRNIGKKEYFVATTDSYQGNSGSAVFNGITGEIEGVLVRGEDDFAQTPQGCNVSKKCAEGACRGEDVTRASEFAAILRNVRR